MQSIRTASFLAAKCVQTVVPRPEMTFLPSFSHLSCDYCGEKKKEKKKLFSGSPPPQGASSPMQMKN